MSDKKSLPLSVPLGTQMIEGISEKFSQDGRIGTFKTWYTPQDCRPIASRIILPLWDDERDLTAIVVTGSNSDLIRLGSESLPNGASNKLIVECVTRLANRYIPTRPGPIPSATVVANILVRSGFRLDYTSNSWKKDFPEGLSWFIRSPGDAHSVTLLDDTLHNNLMPHITNSEFEVQVGIMSRFHDGIISTVAPSLEEALILLEDNKLPEPVAGADMLLTYESLFGMPVLGR
jgi:hypothetical protein